MAGLGGPGPRATQGSQEVKLLEERLRAFQAENQLLGRTLRAAQAEKQQHAQALSASQAEATELRRQLQTRERATEALRREVEDLKIVAAKRDEHLDQSLAHRQELESLVVELQTELNRQPWSVPTDEQPRDSAALDACCPRPTRTRDQQGSPTLSRRVEAALSRPGGRRHHSPVVQAIQSQQDAKKAADLRQEIARLEELYQSKLQLVQQQADARIAEIQQRYREAAERAQSAARQALDDLRSEVVQQITDAEDQLQRQVQHQDRLLDQLQKRCAALDLQLKAAQQQAAAAVPQRQQARDSGVSNSGGGHSTELGGSWCKGVGENGPQAERTGLMAELTTLRRQLLALHSDKHTQSAGMETASAALASHKQRAEDALQRLRQVRQELCTALEQQHALTSENAQLQEKLLTQTAQLAGAESAITELRATLADTRDKLLAAQSSTVSDALQLALKDVKHGKGRDQDNPATLSTYVRVLEHSLREADAKEAALKRAVAEGQWLEEQTRRLLAASRDEQIAMRKSLVQQVHRVQALESIRLSDSREAARLVSADSRST